MTSEWLFDARIWLYSGYSRAFDLLLPRRHQRKRHADGRTTTRRRDDRNLAAELLRHQVVDDVKAKTGTALRSSGGEERVEHVALDSLRNADAIIRKGDLDLIRAKTPCLDHHVPARRIRKPVREGVEDEICQHLPVGTREAVHDDIGRHRHRQ